MVENVVGSIGEEKTLRWFLEDGGGGTVQVCVRDDQERLWTVISFNSAGRAERWCGIPKDSGLCVDSEGRVVLETV